MDTPASLGFRWPAEWEPHRATWLSWPHNDETWPGRMPAVRRAFAAMVAALRDREEVCINVGTEALEDEARRTLREHGSDPDRGVHFFRTPTDDAWVRDHGPVFVVRGAGERRERAVIDFEFNAWGGRYPPWDRDAAVTVKTAEVLGLRSFEAGMVLEGGSIDGNGDAMLLTTESCLLHPNRRPRTRASSTDPAGERDRIERVLEDFLAVEKVLWLQRGIVGDDTDGHVDEVARFVAASTIVAAVEEDESDPNHAPLCENARRLRSMRDRSGKPFDVIELPMPPPIEIEGIRCPASYANFYLANGVALVPSFGVSSDERAFAILREALGGRDVVAIPSEDLIVGLGAVHCLTQSEPR